MGSPFSFPRFLSNLVVSSEPRNRHEETGLIRYGHQARNRSGVNHAIGTSRGRDVGERLWRDRQTQALQPEMVCVFGTRTISSFAALQAIDWSKPDESAEFEAV